MSFTSCFRLVARSDWTPPLPRQEVASYTQYPYHNVLMPSVDETGVSGLFFIMGPHQRALRV